MADQSEPKRKAGRPPSLDFKAAELKLYISPETNLDWKAFSKATGIPGAEIGRRLIDFFLACPRAIQMSVIGRGEEVSEADWSAIARMLMPGGDVAGKIGPEKKSNTGGGSVIDKVMAKRESERQAGGAKARPHLDPSRIKDAAKPYPKKK